ncbi:porin family protein [Pontibacter silvestris]|uniref:Porin family protein n=1 Tax=Pontibacter silvestris TaxID=2305183 RepID=A0ABW4WSF5_9BACT|nr:porin family protein [Pontibacter silvestris]MCC9137804.1 PorT family protein [Pontibacter silvestris]
MKKILRIRLSLLTLLVVFASGAMAQTQNEVLPENVFEPEMSVGIKAGVSLSQVGFTPSVSQELSKGYTAGAVFKYISVPSLGIQVEANYTQKGWTESLEAGSTYSRRLNYLEMPFMTHVEIGKKSSRFILHLGPQASFLLSESESISLQNGESTPEYYGSSIDYKFDLGMCLGVGYGFRSAIGTFQLETRFAYSLSDIMNDERSFSSSKNQGGEVTLSYLFNM